MLLRLVLLFVLLHISLQHTFAEPPDWTIDPTLFDHSTNIVGQLYINDVLDANAGNIIAAFVGDELRGVASGQVIGLDQYYFLKIYSSTPSTDTLSFKIYIAAEDAVYDITESLIYTQASTSTLYAFNTYLDIDQPISLNGIADQRQVVNFPFDSIYLPDYLVQIDDDPIIWTYAGNSALDVTIENAWLKVSPLNTNWTGTETIMVTATEQTSNLYSASQTIDFTVLPDHGAPEWSTLSGQKIGLNQSFESVDLAASLLPYAGTSLAYDYFMTQSAGSGSALFLLFNPSGFQYSMSVTAHVRYGSTDHAGQFDRLVAYIDNKLAGVAIPQLINGQVIYFLTIYSNTNNAPVTFKVRSTEHNQIYTLSDELTFQNGAENGTPDQPIIFNTAPLEVNVVDATSFISVKDQGWIGTQEVAFIAYDTFQPLVNADTIYADFTVVDEYAPEVSGISDRYIEQGGSFQSFDLDNHIKEFDGDPVYWTISNSAHLEFSISNKNVVYTTVRDSDWTGQETVRFRATDNTLCGLYGEQSVTFTVGAPNQAPEIMSIPAQVIGLGDTFPDLNLNDYLVEPNADPVSWSYFFKKQNLEEGNPGWSINPLGFAYDMTMTTRVKVREDYPVAMGHQLAAFHEGSIRGLAMAQEVNGDWVFFMKIYSNQSNDSIYFQYYNPDQQAIYAIDDSLRFISQLEVGTINDPFDLYAGFVDPQATQGLLHPDVVDTEWLGADTLYAVATEVGTYERYRDTMPIIFRVQASSPVLPVDLVSFTGKIESQTTLLNWEVANPDQIQVYEIHRGRTSFSGNDLRWISIGHQLHEIDQSAYRFVDLQPFNGKNYYRLKMIDEDGSYIFSDVIMVDFGENNFYKINCFPNPVSKQIHVQIENQVPGLFELELVNAMGHSLLKMEQYLEEAHAIIVLDVEQYPSGQYHLKTSHNYRVQVIPFILMKP